MSVRKAPMAIPLRGDQGRHGSSTTAISRGGGTSRPSRASAMPRHFTPNAVVDVRAGIPHRGQPKPHRRDGPANCGFRGREAAGLERTTLMN